MKKQTLLFYAILIYTGSLAQVLNHYYGNLHAHTGFSDGNKDSSVSGVSNPSGSYAFAKLSQNFDFLGISEHNHYSSAGNPGFKLPRYQDGLNMAAASNQEGQFVCLFGMEWGVSSSYNGHVLVYGVNQLMGWEIGIPGVGTNYSIFNAKSDYDGLFKKVKNISGAFCYLAHPYVTDFSTGASAATALAYSPYNAAYDSAIIGLPLRSGLAFSTSQNYDDYSFGNYFDYFKRLLYVGYHLGIGYDHDNHYTNFGRSNGGRLVVMAPSLSRQDIMDAMRSMRFYGSDDPNAELHFTLENNPMGSICSGSVYPSISVQHIDRDGELADSIKIWRGFKNDPSGQYAQVVHIQRQSDITQWTDYGIQAGIEYYYFTEVKQNDGQWIAGSPIWYTASAPVTIAESTNTGPKLLYRNDVSRATLCAPAEDFFNYSLYALDGRCLAKGQAQGQVTINLHALETGVYWILFKQHTITKTFPLVITNP